MKANTPEMQKWIQEANEAEFREYLVNQMDENNTVVLNGKSKKILTVQDAIAYIYEMIEFLVDIQRATYLIRKYKKISIVLGLLFSGGGISTLLRIWSVI